MAQVTWTLEAQTVHGHYRIAYLIKAGSEDIEILGIFQGALPIDRYLL